MHVSPDPFEPLLLSPAKQEPLLAKAHDLARAATALAGRPVPPDLRALLRAMNSYYSNRIEGQHTRPLELEQALRRDFSANALLAARQRLAIAHIDTEVAIEARYATPADAAALYTPQAVQEIHTALFCRLPASDLNTTPGLSMQPGQLRKRQVSAGRHAAPKANSLGALLDRWATFYGGVRRGEAAWWRWPPRTSAWAGFTPSRTATAA